MKIVIVGGGKVGEVLCAELSSELNDIILIEKNSIILERLINKFDITGIEGNGASYDIQIEAGVQTADIFIAASEMDEVNIIAAILAKKIGAEYTIARVRNPEYSSQLNFVRETLGISLMINPELSAARDIARILKYPSALSVESFAGNKVNLIEIEVTENSPLNSLSLKDFRSRFGTVLVCIIHRDEEIIIPSGSTFLKVGDRIHVTGTYQDLAAFFKIVCRGDKQVKSTLIVGGGRIAYYLLHALSQSRVETKVIDISEERCEFLSHEFPNATIIQADGTDHDILEEQMINEYDSFVSLTGVDEENLMASIFAKHKGVPKVITKMSRIGILKVLKNINLRSFITPKQIVASEIIQFVRARANTQGSNVEALYRIADNQVEALQFRVKRGSRVCDIPLTQLQTKPDLLVAHIIRGQNVIYPTGNDRLQPHDRVIVVTREKSFDDIDEILK
ncbi:Trk system potassium transporter TrkA [Granulicatella seriolae]|uniref:Trk system potassium uptake protein TrkA n=1 Tax=Granulicatella seriolae TaxID=2967226 RepID=A0ABT1WLR0_9LACT|nr:Trk system potassium transporter TrkA [Granulicatella seriolae]